MKNHPDFIREWQNSNVKGLILLAYPGCSANVNPKASGYNIIYEGCENVDLLGKFNKQQKPFSFYLIKK